MRRLKLVGTMALCAALVSCSWFDDSVQKPWQAYGFLPGYNRLEWLGLGSFATQRDCMERTRFELEKSGPEGTYFKDPIGYLYSGNNYWAAQFFYFAATQVNDVECLARKPGSSFGEYQPVLKGQPRRTASYYCL